jgi:hypothetical protein
MKTKPAAWVGPILGLLIFSLAIWVLHRELAAYRFQDIIQQVHAIPAGRAAMALLLTAAAYGVMTLYDLLALRYLKQSLSYAKIALAAFVGASFSNNIGLSMLAGASVRYRLYANWGQHHRHGAAAGPRSSAPPQRRVLDYPDHARPGCCCLPAQRPGLRRSALSAHPAGGATAQPAFFLPPTWPFWETNPFFSTLKTTPSSCTVYRDAAGWPWVTRWDRSAAGRN